MNIAVNTRVLLKERMEGVSRYIYETTKRMVLAHPEDTFYFYFDRPYDESFVFAENVIPVVIRPPARHPVLWYIWFEWSVPRYLKKHKIDVFYSGDTFMSLSTDVPTVLVCHDIAYHEYPNHIRKSHLKYYRKYFPQFHKKAKHIIAVSEFTKKYITEAYALNPDKITVGHNATPEGFVPISDSERQEVQQEISDGKPYFIYVGSLHPRKNVVTLIKAFDVFKSNNNTNHKLVLVGRMAWKNEELQETFNEIKHKDDIVFIGHLEKGLHKYMAAAEALTYVSKFEGFGIPILEAMSANTPVITSNISSMPEVAGDAALLVNPEKSEEIAEAMEQIVTDGPLRKVLIEKGQQRTKLFSWDETTKRIYTHIENARNKA